MDTEIQEIHTSGLNNLGASMKKTTLLFALTCALPSAMLHAMESRTFSVKYKGSAILFQGHVGQLTFKEPLQCEGYLPYEALIELPTTCLIIALNQGNLPQYAEQLIDQLAANHPEAETIRLRYPNDVCDKIAAGNFHKGNK